MKCLSSVQHMSPKSELIELYKPPPETDNCQHLIGNRRHLRHIVPKKARKCTEMRTIAIKNRIMTKPVETATKESASRSTYSSDLNDSRYTCQLASVDEKKKEIQTARMSTFAQIMLMVGPVGSEPTIPWF